MHTLARGLRSRGHESFVFSMKSMGEKSIEVVDGVPYHRELDGMGLVMSSASLFEVEEKFADMVVRRCLEYGVDVLHLQYEAAMFTAGKVKETVGIPVVLTLHNTTLWLKKQWARPMDRRAEELDVIVNNYWRNVDTYVAISDYIRRSFSISEVQDRIRVIHNGIDTDFFRYDPELRVKLRSQLDFSDDDFVILNPGRFSEDKGQHVLLEALKILSPRFPNIRLVLTGPVDENIAYREKMREMGRSLELQSVVTYRSFEKELMAGVYSMSDLVVTPVSQKDFGFLLTVAEALACERMVVVTRSPFLDEMLPGGCDQVIPVERTPEGVADGVAEAIESNRYRSRSEVGRQLIVRNFSVARMVQEYEGIFKSLKGVS